MNKKIILFISLLIILSSNVIAGSIDTTIGHVYACVRNDPPHITLSNPENNLSIGKKVFIFECAGKKYQQANVTNMTLHIWDSNGDLVYSETNHTLNNHTNYTFDYTLLYEDNFTWNCYGCDDCTADCEGESHCSWGNENFTLNIDTCIPSGELIWLVNCTNNCTWNEIIEVVGNISLNGTGRIILNNIMRFLNDSWKLYKEDGCIFKIESGGKIE